VKLIGRAATVAMIGLATAGLAAGAASAAPGPSDVPDFIQCNNAVSSSSAESSAGRSLLGGTPVAVTLAGVEAAGGADRGNDGSRQPSGNNRCVTTTNVETIHHTADSHVDNGQRNFTEDNSRTRVD
jgi:hypothetical protein